MRIATWNVNGGLRSANTKEGSDIEDIGYFAKELNKIKPDVVCFQEIHVSKGNNQPKLIAEALGFKYVKTKSIAKSHITPGAKLSISIISKHPIVSSKFNMLPNPELDAIYKGNKIHSHDKGFLEATISYNSKKFRVLSGHMVPFHRFGKTFLDPEFKNIRKSIENIVCKQKTNEVVCADMNFEDIHKLVPGVFKKGFRFVLPNKPTHHDKKYDKILVSKDLKVSNAKIVKGKADHSLCFVDVKT